MFAACFTNTPDLNKFIFVNYLSENCQRYFPVCVNLHNLCKKYMDWNV